MELDEGAASADRRPVRGGTLTILGCDGSYPGPGGAASGYLVRGGGATVWLDAGAGTFAALQLVADPGGVDAVVLSHEHPDHWTEVESLAVWLRGRDPSRPVPVYAPPGLRARSYFAEDRVLAWNEIDDAAQVVVRSDAGDAGDVEDGSGGDGAGGGLRLSFSATDHGPPTLAVRVDRVAAGAPQAGGLAFGYTADTGPNWTPEALGAGIGLLLCEATYTKEHEGEARHLSGRQAGALASGADVRRLVLTHRRPSTDADALAREAAEAFGSPVEQAVAGRVLRW